MKTKTKQLLAIAALAFSSSTFAGGYFEAAHMGGIRDSGTRWLEVEGWACEPSMPDFQGWIHFWRDDGVFLGALPANVPREPAVGAACNGNAVHGFSGILPSTWSSWRSGHRVQAYFIRLDNSVFELTQTHTVRPVTVFAPEPCPVC